MKELIDALLTDSYATLGKIRSLSGGCPACILAAILQSETDLRRDEEHINFDYKKEKDEWYDERFAIHIGR